MATRASHRFRGRLNDPPRPGIGYQRRKDGVIELMATTDGLVGGEQWLASERQVPDGVEDLVANEFVAEPQAVRIEDAVLAHNEGVLERRPERVAGGPQFGDVAHE